MHAATSRGARDFDPERVAVPVSTRETVPNVDAAQRSSVKELLHALFNEVWDHAREPRESCRQVSLRWDR